MSQAPNLLNDDGNASIATALMMSHHGLRRDLARFANALGSIEQAASSRIEAIRGEWQKYRSTLHGHHEAEDQGVFPHLQSQSASLEPTITRLSAEHRLIDPLLDRGDQAFAALPEAREARALIAELGALLDAHLALEEAELLPFLRSAKTFPPIPDDQIPMMAEGFAWSTQGVADDVLERVYEMLPENLRRELPAASAAFRARCERVWGTFEVGAARTPIPDAV